MPLWIRFSVETLSAFIVAAGATLTGHMVGSDAVTMPTTAVWIVALVGGLVAAANQARALVAQPPKKPSP